MVTSTRPPCRRRSIDRRRRQRVCHWLMTGTSHGARFCPLSTLPPQYCRCGRERLSLNFASCATELELNSSSSLTLLQLSHHSISSADSQNRRILGLVWPSSSIRR